MQDVINEALKLDPHHLLDAPGRPADNFTLYSWSKMEALDINGVSVQLMNMIIKTALIPFVVTHEDVLGKAVKVCLFVEGNTMDELLEMADEMDAGAESSYIFTGYRLPRNNELIRMQAYHGKFVKK